MKYIFLFTVILGLSSCSKKMELNGKWVILDMTYLNTEIYPNTKSDRIEISTNVIGFEGAEKIEFKTADSLIIFPGFDTKRSRMRFSVNPKSQFLTIEDSFKVRNLTDTIFCQNYKMILKQGNSHLSLQSDYTTINLINEEYLVNNRIRSILNN